MYAGPRDNGPARDPAAKCCKKSIENCDDMPDDVNWKEPLMGIPPEGNKCPDPATKSVTCVGFVGAECNRGMTMDECLAACEAVDGNFCMALKTPWKQLCQAAMAMGKADCQGFCQMSTIDFKTVD